MALSAETVLQRLPALCLHVHSDGRVEIVLRDRVVVCGPHGLAVLDAFSQPLTLAAALERLRTRVGGAHDLVDLTQTVVSLYEAGVLVDPAAAPPTLAPAGGYDAARVHVAMLDDRARTSRLLAAIREVVRPGDVVVDLGTGTGVLAVAAARSGARRVYAIEAGGIARSARRLFEANGVADRVTLVEGWSTRVTLPERADVLVSETIGNEPLGEGAFEFLADARKRLLKPGARLIPSRLRLFGLPVDVPPAETKRRRFTSETLERWRSWYGIDFSPLAEADRASSAVFFVNPHRARDWKTLSAPVLLAAVDFATRAELVLRTRRTVTAAASGVLSGVLLFFELTLGPKTTLTTEPRRVRRDNHWSSPVWLLPEPIRLRRGERFVLRYSHGPAGGHVACAASPR